MEPMPSTKIGAALRQFRKNLRLTQDEIARQVGATRTQYANWESSQAIPAHYLSKLAELGFNPEHEPNAPSPDAPTRTRATRGQLSLLVDMLRDCTVPENLRDSAWVELRKALNLDESD